MADDGFRILALIHTQFFNAERMVRRSEHKLSLLVSKAKGQLYIVLIIVVVVVIIVIIVIYLLCLVNESTITTLSIRCRMIERRNASRIAASFA